MNVAAYVQQIKQYGLYNCLYRFYYILIKKTGVLKRRFPVWKWDERPLVYWVGDRCPTEPIAYKQWREQQGAKFFFPLGEPPDVDSEWQKKAVSQADAILSGKLTYFFSQTAKLGFPFKWSFNPFTGYRDEVLKHWCQINTFDQVRKDIKVLWEPARFGWAYTLVRAYNATGDEKYARAFWQLWESFCQANPIQMGVNWVCGQEIAIRSLACIFSLHVFWKSDSTTPERVERMSCFLAASAERIAKNIKAARVQMGNHAVSEAAALWTIGSLFPEFKKASYWKRLGQYVLENEARRYNFSDGSYTQHSMNYQRLMLHNYLWCTRLAELNGSRFSKALDSKIKSSREFLSQLQDELTGLMPNYGPNDGALILPLNDCDYTDYRPLIGGLYYLYNRKKLYQTGPWEEDILWLFGSQTRQSELEQPERQSNEFRDGGYYTIRNGESWGMIRCHSYTNRPNQADLLHLDLWWKGINLLCDTGSFSYYDPEDNWNAYFVSTAAHNTVVIDNQDQMVKGDRFQWLTLAKSKLLHHVKGGSVEILQGEHYGYKRLPSQVICRRTVCCIGGRYWLIIDDLFGRGETTARLLWHIPDSPYKLDQDLKIALATGDVKISIHSIPSPSQLQVARAVELPRRMGWRSLYYGTKEPCLTAYVELSDALPIRYITLVDLTACGDVECDPKAFFRLSENGQLKFEVSLSPLEIEDTRITAQFRDETLSL